MVPVWYYGYMVTNITSRTMTIYVKGLTAQQLDRPVYMYMYVMYVAYQLFTHICTNDVHIKSTMRMNFFQRKREYSETWKLGTPRELWKKVLNFEVILHVLSVVHVFPRSISMQHFVHCIGLDIGVSVLNSQVVPISQVVL